MVISNKTPYNLKFQQKLYLKSFSTDATFAIFRLNKANIIETC